MTQTSNRFFDEMARLMTDAASVEATFARIVGEAGRLDVLVNCAGGFWKQLSVEETSAVLAIPEGTVKSRLARALDRLRELLERRDG